MLRIKAEHPNDENAISNNRVKGQLKVTRAFGAGFLKQVGSIHSLHFIPVFFFEKYFHIFHWVESLISTPLHLSIH